MSNLAKKYALNYNYFKDTVENPKINDKPFKLILKHIVNNSKILEFGPAYGYLTRYLNEHMSCEISIVEIDSIAAKFASNYATTTLIGNIEDLHWVDKFRNEKYDYIIFADVLEHLKDPWTTLRNAKKLLKDNGKVIVSIPNIGHNSVLIDLWNNRFKYEETGIMDNTHLRFFGINNLDDLFNNTSLSIISVEPVYFSLSHPQFKGRFTKTPWYLKIFTKLRKYSNVYQIVIVAQKEEYVNSLKLKCINHLK